MKRLNSVRNSECELEVVECDCGFHLGIDATYLDQVEDCVVNCPACDSTIDTSEVFPARPCETAVKLHIYLPGEYTQEGANDLLNELLGETIGVNIHEVEVRYEDDED